MQRYGFETVADAKPATMAQRGRRLAENVLMPVMVLAHNPVALRRDTLLRGRRLRPFLSLLHTRRLIPASSTWPRPASER
jgi:hypothetical protein